jgi:hypothetical protein
MDEGGVVPGLVVAPRSATQVDMQRQRGYEQGL